jgi:hypothetical protein
MRLHGPALGKTNAHATSRLFRSVILGGRAGSGSLKTVESRAPCGGTTSTFVAALRYDGIEVPGVFDGPINNMRFLAYVEQCLVPTLRPGDFVVGCCPSIVHALF